MKKESYSPLTRGGPPPFSCCLCALPLIMCRSRKDPSVVAMSPPPPPPLHPFQRTLCPGRRTMSQFSSSERARERRERREGESRGERREGETGGNQGGRGGGCLQRGAKKCRLSPHRVRMREHCVHRGGRRSSAVLRCDDQKAGGTAAEIAGERQESERERDRERDMDRGGENTKKGGKK
ncbi:unnamed protein product [Boreogadus saida]